MTTINTPEGIRHFQLVQLKHRLKLEAAGMGCHGPSALSQAKRHFGCTGNRAKVQEQIEALIENSLAVKKYRGAGLYNCCTDLEPPNWTDFDSFEIMPLQICVENGDTFVETVDTESEKHNIDFWSVYGHLHDGGIECITDCSTQKQAEAIVELFEREHMDEMQVAAAIRASKTELKH